MICFGFLFFFLKINMSKLTWNKFYNLLITGQLRGGDIVFIATPSRHGMIHQHAIKFAQHLRSGHFGHVSEYDDDPHVLHGCVITEKQTQNGPHLVVCESRPPRTQEMTFDKFLNYHKDREFSIFRPHSQNFAHLINFFSLSYTSLKIKYTNPIRTLQTLGPKNDYSRSNTVPESTNCATFVSTIFNAALEEINKQSFHFNIARLPFEQVTPMRLCTVFRLKELYEKSVYQIRQ